MIGPLGRSEGAEGEEEEGWRLGGLACDDVTAGIELICGVERERERERVSDTELLNPTVWLIKLKCHDTAHVINTTTNSHHSSLADNNTDHKLGHAAVK